MKIVIPETFDLNKEQIARLKKLGEVKFYNDLPKTTDEWLERVKCADIICSGKFGLKEKIGELKNKFISLPFVSIDWVDRELIRKNNLTLSYSPGCNKVAVAEWIVGMILNLMREFPGLMNAAQMTREEALRPKVSLAEKNITILGQGNVGSRVGKILESFDAKINYFKKGDDLKESVKNADVVINALSSNPTTKMLLNQDFFQSLKKGAYFITVTSNDVYDAGALIEAIDNGIITGAASDCAGIMAGNTNDPYYQKLLKYPKIIVTPHIASHTDVTNRVRNDMMIDNIEAWVKGEPINLIE